MDVYDIGSSLVASLKIPKNSHTPISCWLTTPEPRTFQKSDKKKIFLKNENYNKQAKD